MYPGIAKVIDGSWYEYGKTIHAYVYEYTITCESTCTCTLESLKLLMVPGMNVLANLEHPEPIEEARVPMIPRVVMMWFLLESERRALRAPGSSPRDGSMNLAALMIS